MDAKTLIEAIEAGDEARVRAALEAGVDPNAEHEYKTPLATAAREGHGPLVSLLIERGATLRSSVLGEAATNGHEALVEQLLGADWEPEVDSWTMGAVLRNGHRSIFDRLRSLGMPCGSAIAEAAALGDRALVDSLFDEAGEHDQAHALQRAVGEDELGVVEDLLRRKVSIGHSIREAKSEAIRRRLLDAGASLDDALFGPARGGDHATVEALLREGAKPSPPVLGGAASNGHLDVLKLLLEACPELSILDPLKGAARSGHVSIVTHLLERLPSKEQHRKEHLAAALNGAAGSGHAEVVRLLLERGAPPDAGYEGGRPLREAASSGHRAVVELLLQRGADIDKPDIIEMTPIMGAANVGNAEMVGLLIDAGANLGHASRIGETVLTTAIGSTHQTPWEGKTCVDLLLDAGAPVRAAKKDSPRSPLREAIEHDRLELAKRLFELGADLREASFDGGLVTEAAKRGRLAILQWLADEGLPVGEDPRSGHKPIEQAAQNGHTAVVRWLIERGETIDPMTLLHGASRGGSLDGIRLAVELGADVNAPCGYGDSRALIEAAASGRVPAVKLLLELGADPNAENGNGETAMTRAREPLVKNLLRNAGALENRLELIDAAEAGNLEAARSLLSEGARIDVAIEEYGERRGLTPLMAAAGEGHLPLVRLLLEAKAAPNRVDDDGWSAVMHAADAGHGAVVGALIDAGVDLLLKDHQRFTAYALAKEAGHDEVVARIEAVGGHRDLREELQQALWDDDVAKVKEVLELDPNVGLPNGESLIGRAAYDGKASIVKLLLERLPEGFDVDGPRVYGRTLLMSAAARNDGALAKAVLDRGADATLKDDDGKTAFETACGNGGHEVAKVLLESDLVDDEMLSAGLRMCFEYPTPEILAMLLERGPVLDARDSRQLLAANTILEAGEDVAVRFDDDEEALRGAVYDGHASLTRFLLTKGVKPVRPHPDDPPLAVAAASYPEMLRAFIDADAPLEGVLVELCFRLWGPDDDESLPDDLMTVLLAQCDPNEKDEDGRTPIMGAARAGHAMVKRLIEAGADPNAKPEYGSPALMAAAASGHMETVALLIKAGADTSLKDDRGWTLVMSMMASGDLEGAEGLLKNGASAEGLPLAAAYEHDPEALKRAIALQKTHGTLDFEWADANGKTAMIHAASSGDETLVRILLDAGAGLGAAIHGAVRMGDPPRSAWIQTLLELGADVDATDAHGGTALHEAAYEGDAGLVETLLAAGANASVADQAGITPLMSAVDSSAEDVVRMLLKAGADRSAKDAKGETAADKLWDDASRVLKKLVQP